MNCRTFQHDLSQCLDGRLPSGRRQVVMDHVASCDACSQFWAELQRAQELVLHLPRQRVTRDFREQLFERIETGEGTPAAVFGEPVPLMKKARYVLTGAAAAAAVLVVVTMARRDFGAAPGQDARQDLAALEHRPEHRDELDAKGAKGADARRPDAAAGDAPGVQAAGGMQVVRGVPPSPQGLEFFTQNDPLTTNWLGAARPLTSNLVAVEAAKQLAHRVNWTTDTLQRLDQGDPPSHLVRTVCDNAVDIGELGSLLLDLREEQRVTFTDPDIDVELRFVVRRLRADRDQLRRRDIDTVRTVVAPVIGSANRLGSVLAALRLPPLSDGQDAAAQEVEVLELSQTRPGVFEQLFIPLHTDPQGFQLDPGAVFAFRGACGPNVVVPRSEAKELQQRYWLLQRVQRSQHGGTVHVRVHAGPQSGGRVEIEARVQTDRSAEPGAVKAPDDR